MHVKDRDLDQGHLPIRSCYQINADLQGPQHGTQYVCTFTSSLDIPPIFLTRACCFCCSLWSSDCFNNIYRKMPYNWIRIVKPINGKGNVRDFNLSRNKLGHFKRKADGAIIIAPSIYSWCYRKVNTTETILLLCQYKEKKSKKKE